jgi:hypothetical protein
LTNFFSGQLLDNEENLQLGADETLFFDDNNMQGIRIAPGEGNRPTTPNPVKNRV